MLAVMMAVSHREEYRTIFSSLSDADRGTKDWQLDIGDSANGPFHEIANGSFPDPSLTMFNVPLTVVTPSGYNIPTGQVGLRYNCYIYI